MTLTSFPRGALRSSPSETARLWGRAKGTSGSVSITVNRHEELSDRSAPYADFGHGSLFEAAPGAAGFIATTESPTKFLFKPFKLCMEDGGLHAYFNRRQASPSTAASGLNKTSGSGQGPSTWRDLGVRCGPPIDPLPQSAHSRPCVCAKLRPRQN